jgi:flagellar hook-length control protein FliK
VPAVPAAVNAAVRLPLPGKPLPQATPGSAKPATDTKTAAATGPAKPAAPAAATDAPGPVAPAAPPATAGAPAAAAQVADATAKPSDSPAQAQPAAPAAPPLAAAAFAAPAAAPTTAPAGPPARLVPMGRVVENTAALLHVAAERGVTHARLNLKPVELGGIEVRLRATADGVAAQLVADSPEAARMLSQAGDDLRRQLADQNVNLLSLDVSTSGDQQQGAAQFSADAGAGDGYRSGGSSRASRTATDLDPDGALAPAATETTLLLPTGVLVDVLA